MPAPLPLPMRVLVNGASTVSWASWMLGAPKADFTFPRATEQALLAGGRAVEVRNVAILAAPNRHLYDGWERDIVHWSPDVVVIVPGHMETIHLFLPRWLERHANTLERRPTPVRKLYYRGALRVVWKSLVQIQKRADLLLGRPKLQRRLRRAVRDLKGYIELVRPVSRSLVIVLEILPPGSKNDKYFPGLANRIDEMNRLNRELVESMDEPDIRFLPVSPMAHALVGDDLGEASQDGLHPSPAVHHAIGDELARIIEAWARRQPHLQAPVAPKVDEGPELGTAVSG